MIWYHNARDNEYATAVAAAAFAIHSLEQKRISKMTRQEDYIISSGTRKEDFKTRKPSFGEALVKMSMKHKNLEKPESAFPSRQPSSIGTPPVRAVLPENGYQMQSQRETSARHNDFGIKADAWEKAKLEKIRKRYEKIKSKILQWANVRKMQAKLQMEREKSEMECRGKMQLQYYRSKLARIDMIAEGARAQAEENRRKEESVARERAKKIRSTGRVPTRCFCFICQ